MRCDILHPGIPPLVNHDFTSRTASINDDPVPLTVRVRTRIRHHVPICGNKNYIHPYEDKRLLPVFEHVKTRSYHLREQTVKNSMTYFFHSEFCSFLKCGLSKRATILNNTSGCHHRPSHINASLTSLRIKRCVIFTYGLSRQN